MLAITKCDMLDAELTKAIKKELPRKVTCVMISSVANTGLETLKDALAETPSVMGLLDRVLAADRSAFLAHQRCA